MKIFILLLCVSTNLVSQDIIGTWVNVVDQNYIFKFESNGNYVMDILNKPENKIRGIYQLNGIELAFGNPNHSSKVFYKIYFIGTEMITLIDPNQQMSTWVKSESNPFQRETNIVHHQNQQLSNNQGRNQTQSFATDPCNGTYFFQGAIGDDRIQQFNEWPVNIKNLDQNHYLIEENQRAFRQGNEIYVPGNQIPGFPYRHRIVIKLNNGGCDGAHFSKTSSLKMEGKIYKNKPNINQGSQSNPWQNYQNSAVCSCCNGSGKGRESSCSRCSGSGQVENDKTDIFGNKTRTSYSCGICNGTGKTTSWSGCTCCGGRGRN